MAVVAGPNVVDVVAGKVVGGDFAGTVVEPVGVAALWLLVDAWSWSRLRNGARRDDRWRARLTVTVKATAETPTAIKATCPRRTR